MVVPVAVFIVSGVFCFIALDATIGALLRARAGSSAPTTASTVDPAYPTLIALAVTAYVSWRVWRVLYRPSAEVTAWKRGAEGERLTAAGLARLPRTYQVFHDLAVPASNANIDHVVIGPTGVFMVETKNYSNPVTILRGRVRTGSYPIDKVVAQAKRQAAQVGRAVGSFAVPLVVIQGTTLEVRGQRSTEVRRVRFVTGPQLVETITRRKAVLSSEQVEAIADRLRQAFSSTAPPLPAPPSSPAGARPPTPPSASTPLALAPAAPAAGASGRALGVPGATTEAVLAAAPPPPPGATAVALPPPAAAPVEAAAVPAPAIRRAPLFPLEGGEVVAPAAAPPAVSAAGSAPSAPAAPKAPVPAPAPARAVSVPSAPSAAPCAVEPVDVRWIEELRTAYRPQQVRWLLVGESAPDPGDGEHRFFYNPALHREDLLYRAVAEAFYGHQLDFDVTDKLLVLAKLKADGVWLLDLCEQPINRLPGGEPARRQARAAAVAGLVERARQAAPSAGVVICHKGVARVAAGPLRAAGLPVVAELPFPRRDYKVGDHTYRELFIAGLTEALHRHR